MHSRSFVNRLSAHGIVFFLLILSPALCRAGDFSFSGTFTRDDQVQLFEVTIAPGATITVRTLSYAGGTNASGQTVARGGFDPVLAVARIDTGLVFFQKDDGDPATTSVDPMTGKAWDVSLNAQQDSYGPGTYIFVLTQFDDYPKSFYLANRFQQDGKETFTSVFPGAACASGKFKDASADVSVPNSGAKGQVSKASTAQCRDGHWAIDFLNVTSAKPVASEPAMLSLPSVSAQTTAKMVAPNLGVPPCELAGTAAIQVDEQGKVLPAPDCVKKTGPIRAVPANADPPDQFDVGLHEVKPR